MDKAAAVSPDVGDQGGSAVHVHDLSHGRVEFARLQGAVADAIEDRAKAVVSEEVAHAGGVLGVERNDAVTLQAMRLPRTGADDLAGVAPLKVMQGVVAGNAGGAGEKQR